MDARHEQRTVNSRVAAIVLPLAAVLPFVLSIVFTSVGSSAQSAVATSKRPALAFDQYLVNLGDIPPRLYAVANFGFQNVGDQPVHIKELKPSCGCLKPRLEKYDFKPGEVGMFHLRIEIPGESPGPKEYTVDVLYEDPEPRTAQVTFKVVLPPPKVEVRPRALKFYQFGEDETKQSVFITDYRSTPLHVVKVETDSPYAKARFVEAKSEHGERLHEIEVTVGGSIPPGTHTANVLVHTSDEEYAKLKIGLEITGQKSFSEQADEVLRLNP